MSARTESRFPTGGGFYAVPVGYEIDEASDANLPAALAKVQQAMTPASVEQCEGWLVMLQAATARRTEGEAMTAVAYSLYASELRQWPADVARAACQHLARGQVGEDGANWFPTLAQLVAECRRLATPRKVLVASLKDRLARGKPKVRAPLPEDERKRVADEFRSLAEKMRTGQPLRDKAEESHQ